jgi:hypothetical protein
MASNVIDEGRMRKEVVMLYFHVLSQHLTAVTEKNHEKLNLHDLRTESKTRDFEYGVKITHEPRRIVSNKAFRV